MTTTAHANLRAIGGNETPQPTDDQLLERLQHLAETRGKLPGRPIVMRELGIGEARARRLLDRIKNGSTTAPPAPAPAAPPRPSLAPISATTVAPDTRQDESSAAHATSTEASTSDNTAPQAGASQVAPAHQPEPADAAPAADQEPPAPSTTPSADDSSQPPTPAPQPEPPRRATWLFIAGAIVGLIVSVDTSWRFFEHKVGIDHIAERIAMFAGLEIVLIGCGVSMYENVQRHGRPGNARWLAWALCAASGYVALQLSGPGVGLARVLFGPVLSVVAFHFALGIEIRARRGRKTGLLAEAVEELQQRLASRLGLGDELRSAAVRTRQRAVRKAARLATARVTPLRDVRLRRNLRLANIAHDTDQQAALLREQAVLASVKELRQLELPSPWQDACSRALSDKPGMPPK